MVKPITPSKMQLVLTPLSDLAHIRTHPWKNDAYIDEIARVMRLWPSDLSQVRNAYSLRVPPIGIPRFPSGVIVLIDGNHRLTAARRAGIVAIYARYLHEYANGSEWC